MKKENKTIRIRVTRYLPFHVEERDLKGKNGERRWGVPFLVYDASGYEISLEDQEGEIPEDELLEAVYDLWLDVMSEISDITGHSMEEVEKWNWDPCYKATDIYKKGNITLYTYDFFFDVPEKEVEKLKKAEYDFQKII